MFNHERLNSKSKCLANI